MYRKTYIEIDVDKIQNNISKILEKYNDYKYYIGVVKGNAYGHGAYLTKYILESGINYLAVSSLEEGIEIRKIVNDVPILCLEPIDFENLDVAIENNITITISSMDYFYKVFNSKFKNLKVHLKLNTGMNRLGINDVHQVEEIYNSLIDNKEIILEGIFTHFATTGIQDKIYDKQLERFRYLTSTIDLKKIEIVHLGRSATLELHPKIDIANGIRLGIVMYGVGQTFKVPKTFKDKLRKIKRRYIIKKNGISETFDNNDISFETGLVLKSEIMEINNISKGEVVGYGGTYETEEESSLAVCPIGYADGLLMGMKKSKVSINGKKYPIVGTINMGMIVIKVDDSVKVGDAVTILGNNISIKDTSAIVGTIPYVLMTTLNPLIPRIYIKNKKVDKIVE